MRAAAVGDSAELLDVDVQQVAGVLALVAPVAVPPAAQQLAGEPVDVGQPGMPARARTAPIVEAAMPRSAASRTGPAWCSRRAATIAATVSGEVRRACGARPSLGGQPWAAVDTDDRQTVG
jgi:hypothetical protein